VADAGGVGALGGGGQEVGELLVGALDELGLGPQIRGEVGVGVADGLEGGLGKVAHGGGLALGGGVAVLNAGHAEQLLGNTSSDNAGTARSGHQAHQHRAALASDLDGHGVGSTDLVAPVAAAHRDQRQLGLANGATDGGGDLTRALDTCQAV
jgi:hypothetical protein